MILHNLEIMRLSTGTFDLIRPYICENVRASSYDLTVGEEYYIGQCDNFSTFETQKLTPHQSITIPPHAICFILAAETIRLPANITARVSLRMSHIYAGMVLTAQPPFDPNYRGKVIIMLHNLSSSPYYLKSGDRVATIEFTRLVDDTTYKKEQKPVETLAKQLTKPLVSSLSEIASASKTTQDKVTQLSGQLLTFAALIVAILALPSFFSYSTLSGEQSKQSDKIEKMQNRIDEYQAQLKLDRVAINQLEERLAKIQEESTTREPASSTAATSNVNIGR
ncbi:MULTISPECIES: dCTP deaminase domain-containing protein [Pseudomonas]|uniref:dCTP deaminase domain-containing protein n=1 Tax=Pseudomonas TaxID=286 RepID=UPI0018E7060D|nr:hypothetical protein [Pseudomonas carnis]MBJ2213336.1 hypothetical protein [Pseudomonas carnis]